MLKKLKLKKRIGPIVFGLFVITAIAFVERKNTVQEVGEIIVELTNKHEHFFLNEQDVKEIISGRGEAFLEGGKLINIDLKELEMRLKKNKFVEGAEVVKDLKGNVIVRVRQVRPLARILLPDSSFYISDNGKRLPLSNRHSARVLLISGEGARELCVDDEQLTATDSGMLDMIKYIYNDQFLSKQIAGISIDTHKELTLYPQVTDQAILFGECEQYVDKFHRLRVAYDQILPRKGWNSYETINLKYKDQIICK